MKKLIVIFFVLFVNVTTFAQMKNRLLEKTELQEEPYVKTIKASKISYLSDGLIVKGYLVEPILKGNYPCIIYNRGGNREFSKLDDKRANYLLGKLASYGYVVIASNYRGSDGGEGKEEFGGKDVNDVLNLIDILEVVENADTSRIGMFGWSRGGMMTYLALTKTDKIKAAVVGGAVSDLSEIDRPEFEANVYADLIPNYNTNKDAELRKRSAVYWVDKFPKNVPILMLHGSSDWRVKPSNSLKMALEFEKHQIPYRLKIFESADHSISQFRDEADQDVINWLNRFVKNSETLPDTSEHGF